MLDNKLKFILSELDKVEHHPTPNGNVKTLCPYHNDTVPSFNINIDDTKRTVPLGWGRCWSCGASYSWNNFAPLLGLRKLDNSLEQVGYAKKFNGNLKEQLLPNETTFTIDELVDKLDSSMNSKIDEDWRGYSAKFLRKFKCHIALDKFDNKVLIIPVYNNREIVGGVKARWKKSKSKKVPSYINLKGGWVKEKGLFPYDYVANMVDKKELSYVIICEGVRDALRLIQEGEPALCIFGVHTWTDKKLKQIKALGVDKIFIMLDAGKAGVEGTNIILESTKGKIQRKAVKMKYYQKLYEKKRGRKVKEIDPHNCPSSLMRRILKDIKKAA